ncbi:unnamed protein product, partial [Strongylus vulgaris]
MIRIVDPMRTYIPWGARLRYTRRPGHHHPHHPHHPPAFDGVIHRLGVQEKKEQLTEQVAKGMQYLTEIGQVVTSALANFGIDASYEVQVEEDKKKKEQEKKENSEEKKEENKELKSEAPAEEKKEEQAENENAAETPVLDNDVKEKHKCDKRHSPPRPVPSFKAFPNLQSAEAEYRQASAKTKTEEPPKISENRQEQDADMKKHRHNPTHGADGRPPLGFSSWRAGYSYRTPVSYDRDYRDYDRYDEKRFARNACDEPKRAREAGFEPKRRDRHRPWSWYSREEEAAPSRRGGRH